MPAEGLHTPKIKKYEDTIEKSNQKYLLTDASFGLLREAQQKISDVTEVMPSLRKLINELINEKSVDDVTTRYIELYQLKR